MRFRGAEIGYFEDCWHGGDPKEGYARADLARGYREQCSQVVS